MEVLDSGAMRVHAAVEAMHPDDAVGLCKSNSELHALENEVAVACGLVQPLEVVA
jgi:hypothetical protein